MEASWEVEVGDVTNRREVMERYGGARFGGIQPSRKTANVFIYSDPKQGAQHGYNFDGWDPNPTSPVFYYTGEGQRGPQDPESKGNGAILRHVDEGRALRLFEVAGPNERGGKPQRYVGEFYVDPSDPWRYEKTPDRDGRTRSVVVYRLIAMEPATSRSISRAGTAPRPPVTGAEFDERRLREVALRWLERRTDGGREVLSLEDIQDFDGGFALVHPAVDLWQPAGFACLLSIREERDVTPDEVVIEGRRITPASTVGGESLTVAKERHLPLLVFQSVGGGFYMPLYPLYVASKDEDGFILSPDETFGRLPETTDSDLEVALKRYAVAETKRRLHQPLFRANILRAYTRRCAVCALKHVSLLDAAHIIPDSNELGVPAVRNGMAMCKLHHSAYDANLLAITPDRKIEIAPRIMSESNGPTLKYGLQGRHGEALMVLPAHPSEWPDPESLLQRYEQFLVQSSTA